MYKCKQVYKYVDRYKYKYVYKYHAITQFISPSVSIIAQWTLIFFHCPVPEAISALFKDLDSVYIYPVYGGHHED